MPQPRSKPATTPRIVLRPDGRSAILTDATAAAPQRHAVKPDGDTYTILGYRQTNMPASKGGTANRKGIRFRRESMRAFARSFRGQPFITAHDWGDSRARGGTIIDAYVEEIGSATDPAGEMAIMFEVVAIEQWAKEGFANGTIDRFSQGALPIGEAICTIHDAPFWEGDCYCWPGAEVDGKICEIEFEGGDGVELSSCNVPAVPGTYVVAMSGEPDEIAELAKLIGRPHRARPVGGAPVGDFAAPAAPITMTPCTTPVASGANQMDRALLCKTLGISPTSTDEEITAKLTALGTDAAQLATVRTQLAETSARAIQLAADQDAAHVESEIVRLRAGHTVSDEVVTDLRTAAKTSRAAFDAAFKLVEKSAPKVVAPTAAPTVRATLQSDAIPAPTPAIAAAATFDGPDAFEQHSTNPSLPMLMRACKLTPDQVRKHGPRSISIVSNLGDLVTATAARG